MAQVLKAPQNFRITGRDRSAQLTWDEVSGAAGYRMFFYDGSEPDKVFKTRYAQGCTRVILGFTNGREYFAEVCAYSVKDGREMLGERSQKVRFVPISLKLTAQKVVCLDLGETAQLFWEEANRVPQASFSSDAKTRFEESRGRFSAAKYKPLLDMDFMCSKRCCDIMKKEPAHRYSKESGKVAITAQMASESALRTQKWLQHGCNAFDNGNPVSNPMSFWTEQDVLLYIKSRYIEICSVYGDVVYDCDEPEQERFSDVTTLKLKTTGCSRTGCMFCAFGAHLEKGETRFQRLARTHPKQYAFCIGGALTTRQTGSGSLIKMGWGSGMCLTK